jgi:hypothetical protein
MCWVTIILDEEHAYAHPHGDGRHGLVITYALFMLALAVFLIGLISQSMFEGECRLVDHRQPTTNLGSLSWYPKPHKTTGGQVSARLFSQQSSGSWLA